MLDLNNSLKIRVILMNYPAKGNEVSLKDYICLIVVVDEELDLASRNKIGVKKLPRLIMEGQFFI